MSTARKRIYSGAQNTVAEHSGTRPLVCASSLDVRRKLHKITHENTGVADSSHLLIPEELPLVQGGIAKWEFYHPARLVQNTLESCPALSAVYCERLGSCPPPWNLLLGYDEHTPGNKVAHDNK